MDESNDESHSRKFIVGLVSLLFLWTLLLRFPTFVQTVLDWDESLYLLMADRWLSGSLPYIDLWDHKPIGIYAIFAAALSLFGRSIISIRIATVIFISLTAVVLYFIGTTLTGRKNSGVVAAVLYPVYSLGLGGTAANTEPFFCFFTMAGLLLLIKALPAELRTRTLLSLLAGAGLAFGMSLQIKYIVILEIAFFVISFFILRARRGGFRSLTLGFVSLIMISFGLILPSAASFLYYRHRGYASEFIYSNFTANQAHIEVGAVRDMLLTFTRSMEEWLGWVNVLLVILILGIAVPYILKGSSFRFREGKWLTAFFLTWISVTVLECCLTLKFYPHYFLVTIPPLCLSAGFSLSRFGLGNLSRSKIILLCLILSCVQLSYITMRSLKWVVTWRTRNHIALVSDYVSRNISADDYIYVVNDQPVYYFLTQARIPTKYAFPPFIIDPHFSRVAGVDFQNELNRIIEKEPRYILINRDWHSTRISEITEQVKQKYSIVKEFGPLDIYRIDED